MKSIIQNSCFMTMKDFVSMIEIKGHFRAELTRDKAVLMFNENCEKEMKISIGYYYDGFDDFKRILSEKSGLTFETKDY